MLSRVLRVSSRAAVVRSFSTLSHNIPRVVLSKNRNSVRHFSVAPESDDAFKPQRKVSQADEEAADLQAQIKEVVTNNKIVLFMKGTPDTPQCGFSSRVVQILGHMNVPYEACNVLESPALREGIKIYSDWPTIPQLYVNGEFIGGCDIVTNMFTSGELHEVLGVPKPSDKQ